MCLNDFESDQIAVLCDFQSFLDLFDALLDFLILRNSVGYLLDSWTLQNFAGSNHIGYPHTNRTWISFILS